MSKRLNRPVRIFLSTGEVSGDLQGALLIQALNRQAQQLGLELEILALGGDRMAAAGAKLLGNTSLIGSIGIFESLPFVFPTLKVQRQAKHYLKDNPPDLVVLIDYMSPNIALCGYLSKHQPDVPLIYYIAPQEWVWALNSYNTDRIVQTTRQVLAIFPQEAHYFEQKGANVRWIGHPLVDRMQAAPSRAVARAALGFAPEQPLVALLPASRQQEIKYLLPSICEAAQIIQAKLPDTHFLVPLALEKYRKPIEQALKQYGLQATLLVDRHPGQLENPAESVTLQAIAAADLAITKSGTVNLEIALMDVPQVVIYKVNAMTAWVLRHILKFAIPFMSPTNLVLMKSIVPELMQDQATAENIAHESLDILLNPQRRQTILADYQAMRQALGEPGVCDRAAQAMLSVVCNADSPVPQNLKL